MLGVRSLADIQMPGAQLKRSADRSRLLVAGCRFQVGVHLVGTPLLTGTGNEAKNEIHLGQCRQCRCTPFDRDALAEQSAPEPGQTLRVG